VLLSILWQLFGFSLVFDHTHGSVIGGAHWFALAKVSTDECNYHAPTIPALAFVAFQMMFAVITPLLITGAIAERVPFKSTLVFMFFWEWLVYYPVAHWIFGDGWLGITNPHWSLGAQDFAGGIVIHTTAGTAAFVSALIIGQRRDFKKNDGKFPFHNIMLSGIGVSMLWVGWFGFNGGSALAANKVAAYAVFNTQIGGCGSGLTWIVLTWIHEGKPTVVGLTNGIIAGLAGITPAAGFVDTQSALVLSIIFGASSYWCAILVKEVMKIDDALDVSSVHGVTGIIGSLAIGFCGHKTVNPGGRDGIFFGKHSGRLLGNQAAAVAIAIVWAAFWTWAIWMVIKYIPKLGLRVSSESEHDGLDASEHHEHAYDDLVNANEIAREDGKMSVSHNKL